MTTERWTPAVVHGRCLVDRPLGVGPGAPLLVGFHGYGETAADVLPVLARIPGSDAWLRCAVESLHPFYTKKGDVVRCWMTKDDRERAMADNIRYVGASLQALRDEEGATGPLVVCGFSQGVAMTWRAAARAGVPCAGVVALAGDVPPELAADPDLTFPATLIGRGRADEWYTDQKLQADLDVLRRKARRVEVVTFDGGHEWSEDFLAATGRFLASVVG